MSARLNIFQQTMLFWSDLHAYNAVHIVRVSHKFEAEKLTQTINGVLQAAGLTNLKLDRARNRFQYLGGDGLSEIRIISPSSEDPLATLSAEITAQVNRAFDSSHAFSPFRFFAIPQPDGFFLGAVYFHPVADAESLVHLLKRIIAAYSQQQTPSCDRWDIHPRRRDHLLQQPVVLARKLAQLPRQLRELRHSNRVPLKSLADGNIGFTLFTIAPEELRGLMVAAKVRHLTVNDLFLALLLKCLAPLTAARLGSSKRPNLSIGCIVNTRKDLGIEGAETFGLFLGSFVVTHSVPEGSTLEALAEDVRAQTARIKQRRLYLGVSLELAIANWLLSFSSTERRRKLYQKNYPLWGGITNMNLNSLWPPADGLQDYFRAVSTGPVTPLVLSVTTVGDRANVGLSYRTTVFSTAVIETFKVHFLETIKGLAR